jgi:hypothetical protein
MRKMSEPLRDEEHLREKAKLSKKLLQKGKVKVKQRTRQKRRKLRLPRKEGPSARLGMMMTTITKIVMMMSIELLLEDFSLPARKLRRSQVCGLLMGVLRNVRIAGRISRL